MSECETASPQKLKRVIENMPAAALPEILVAVVRACVKKKVYGDRSVAKIVETVEAQAKGKLLGQ